MSAHASGVERVAIVGCGVIGSSWAAHYLAQGLDVVATDPAPGASERLSALVNDFWPTLERLGLAEGASPERLAFEPDLTAAVKGAGFVQENGPERVDIKRDLVAAIDAAAGPDVLIASSSSTILISDIQDAARHPGRVLLGHPFNPPHLIPLVEVVGGRGTTAEAIQRALGFYTAVRKRPIHIKGEIRGHVANRLQAALWREAVFLIEQGVATVADIDTVISQGPGLRWALTGPLLNMHLSGGEGGIAHVLEHLGPPMEAMWRDLGDASLTDKVKRELIAGVEAGLRGSSLAELTRQRDEGLVSLLALKAKADQLP